MIEKITQTINNLLLHREVLAILLGVVISLGGTQYVKQQFTDHMTRLRVNLIALPLGALPVFLVFPASYDWQLRASIGAAVGVAAPYIYKGVVWALSKAKPDLAEKFSADL